MDAAVSVPSPSRWPRQLLRTVALALLCGLLQWLLPRYTLGAAALAPLSVVLGVAVAAAMSRGAGTVPAAMLGMLAADMLGGGAAWAPALRAAAVLGAQATLAAWLMRPARDAERLQLDTGPRLRHFALVAAPAAAALGVAADLLVPWGLEAGALSRPQLAGAVGRFIVDVAGILTVAPVLLCWLARPHAPWRPRRRLVALPLVLLVVVLLPGFDQVAQRDETRLQTRFARDVEARRLRVQQLLGDPADVAFGLRGALAVAGQGLPASLFDRLAAGWAQRVEGLRQLGWMEPQGSTGQWVLRQAHDTRRGDAAPRLPGAQAGADGRLHPGPALRQAMDQALASDSPVALTLTDGNAPGAGAQLLVLQSVPDASGSGAPARLVYAEVDARRLLAGALPDDDDPNLRACLTDRGAEAGAPPRRLAGPAGCEHDRRSSAQRAQTAPVTLAQLRLALTLSEPESADNRLFTALWLLALPAVTGAAMLSVLLLMLSGRLRRIEDRVQERTAALQTEIEERRQTEARLTVTEQRFRAIFDNVNIGVTVVDPQGRLTEVNPAFCTMMGCGAAELLQRPLDEIRLPDVAEDDGTAQALGGGQARRQRYLTADGRVLQVAASLRTLHDADGMPVATVGALQDLTQVLRLREAEREREEADIARRTQSEFLARLSHELREPLNAIVGFAQLLGEGDEDDDNPVRRHGLAQIRQAGWHLLDMINDVLDLSHLEAGALRLTLEPLSLADLAQDAAALVEPAAQAAGVTLTLSLSPQAERVQADAVRLRQVLVNLLGNAIKYNRRGGTVQLRTRPAGVGEVLIEVEDNGIGIAEDQLAQLFQPFHRAGRERQGQAGLPGGQGTGIGLVICRKLSALMGGEIEVSSREGLGSTFSLRLPRPFGEPVRREVTAAAPLVSSVSIGTVLCIDTHEDDVAALRELLRQRPGVQLQSAGTAAQGLAMAADADVVLLDLDLPDRPGIELLHALRADTRVRTTPVIVVSAETRPQCIDACFDAGATQFLAKPVDPGQVLRAIDAALSAL